jgi:hypothetical protein
MMPWDRNSFANTGLIAPTLLDVSDVLLNKLLILADPNVFVSFIFRFFVRPDTRLSSKHDTPYELDDDRKEFKKCKYRK